MAAGFVDTYWDESRSNASDSDTKSDEESQVLLFFIHNMRVSEISVKIRFSLVSASPRVNVHRDVLAKLKAASVPHVVSAN